MVFDAPTAPKDMPGDTPQVSKNYNAIITSLTAGAIAGGLAKTVIAPLDRTKINFQVSSSKRYSLRSAIRFLVASFRNDGFFSLYRGNSATLARVVPFAAIQFTTHEQYKRILVVDADGHPPTPLRRYIAGSMAGVTASACTYPLDTARARMAVSPKCQYWNIWSVFIKVGREEGLRGLYRGLTPTLLGSIPYAGTSFFTYESLKIAYYDMTNNQSIPPHWRLLMGAAAGLAGQTSSYPLDICRRRLQTNRVDPKFLPNGSLGNSFVSLLQLMAHIARTEGVVGGLYKGLSMNMFKGPIAVGVSFTTYDTVLKTLRRLPYFE